MAEVVVSQNIVLKVTDSEWKLIMKSLAMMAGVEHLKNIPEEKEKAAALNKQLLHQRVHVLRGQLKSAEDALANTEAETQMPYTGFDVGGRKIGEGRDDTGE